MRHFLVVDDNLPFAENIADIIRDCGHEATYTDAPAKALELIANTRFDALLTDMRMPLMNGADLVRHVRTVDRGLPVLLITAHTRDAELAAARAEGLLAVLPKPVPMQAMLGLLETARRDGLVALVEDDALLADVIEETLRVRGFSTVTATSLGETQHLPELSPFVAIVDMRVPGGADGEAMRRLADRLPELPMLAMSGVYDVSPPVQPCEFFRKPLDPRKLVQAIEEQYSRAGSAMP